MAELSPGLRHGAPCGSGGGGGEEGRHHLLWPWVVWGCHAPPRHLPRTPSDLSRLCVFHEGRVFPINPPLPSTAGPG